MRKRKRECKRGHCFTRSNTYIDKNGGRCCLKCRHMHSIARSQNPGIGSGGFNRLKKVCSAGHLYRGANVWVRTRRGKITRVCKMCTRRRTRENRFDVKLEVIRIYGGKCAWKGCRIQDPDMLTLDHVNDDGAIHRVRGFTSGDAIYRKLVKMPRSNRFQLLCANHNLKKELLRKRANQA